MNYKIWAKLGCRFIALYYFLTYMNFAMNTIVSLLEFIRQTNDQSNIGLFPSIIPFIIMIVLCALLWIFADNIAECLVGAVSNGEIVTNVDYDKIQYIAFNFIGILFIFGAVPDIFSSIFQITFMTKQQYINAGDRTYINYVSRIIGAGIQIGLGLCLVLGAKGIINMIKSLRTLGISERK